MAHLTEDQLTVLKALMVSGPPGADRTEAGLSHRTGLSIRDVGRLLRELDDDFDPPLVRSDVDETLGTRFWWATEAAGDLLEQLGEA
jgi:hypothetical protein